MRRLFLSMFVVVGFLALSQFVWRQATIPNAAGNSRLEFLGSGGTYTVGAGERFIVKRKAPFVFVNEAGPTYTAAGDERVWAATIGAPPAIKPGRWIDYGNVPENCEITYTAVTNGIIEYMVREVGSEKVIYGSDTAMRDPFPQFGWVVYADISEQDKRNILGRNMRKIINQCFPERKK